MANGKPRRTIAQDAFFVAPQLLGLPLASPARRAAAMLIDLILVAILIQVGGGLLGFAAAFVLWRFSGRGGSAGLVKGSVRLMLRVGAAVAIFIVVAYLWGNFQNERGDSEDDADPTVAVAGDGDIELDLDALDLSGPEIIASSRWLMGLRNVDHAATAGRLADSIVATLRRNEISNEDFDQARRAVHRVAQSNTKSAVRAAIDRSFGYAGESVHAETQLITLLSQATEKRDSTAIDTLRQQLRKALAGEDIENLERAVAQREERADSLEKQLAAADDGRGVLGWLRSAADDMGLGFGWMAVYFTGFLALMRGQTPGKKLFGIRVARLDAKPISWWIAFERFGGYAASLTLGLLGFLQILWDRNRQGLHDKAVETVVIEQRAAP